MKLLLAVALVATSAPVLTTTASARGDESASSRRYCTQLSARAGSRMSGRRICRTADEWRDTLGSDWRQHLAGYRGVQDDYDALRARAAPEDINAGIQPTPGGFGPGRAAGPR